MKPKRLFRGDESPKEERAEAKAVKKGSITPKQYAKGEKAEGEKPPLSALINKGKKLKSGAISEEKYAKGMASGGKVKKMANGGDTYSPEGNRPVAARVRGEGRVRPEPVRPEPVRPEPDRPITAPSPSRGMGMARPEGMGPSFRAPSGPAAERMMPRGMRMKDGGRVKKGADGAAIKGKTKGKMY